MTGRQCDCAERSVDRFVFTCPVCVSKVVETSAFRFLTEAVKSVTIDSTGKRERVGRGRGQLWLEDL